MRKLSFTKLIESDYNMKEAFNSLRTNLKFCGSDIKVICITSCTPNEGKSSISFEVARSFAEDGKKTLLIDADMRKSVLISTRKISVTSESRGLSHYLSGQVKAEEVIYDTNVNNLSLVMSGPVTPNPTELLGGQPFSRLLEMAREKFDVVIIDSPPLGSVIDAAVMAPYCDGVIMVIESNVISYHFAQEVKKQLELTNCRILGAVLNKAKVDKNGYYGKYYRGYY